MKLIPKPLLLFLDFDGVLHPKLSSSNNFFSKLKIFEETIGSHKNIQIVISSNWRYQYTFDELVALFSIEIQRRIVDSTRDKSISKAKNRYEEIIDYLEHTKKVQCPWIAIDDAISEFPINISNAVFCNPNIGFDEEAARQLKQILKMFKS